MSERVVVVGADAAGMSAASQAKRVDDSLEIVALERGSHTSYSACGIPYWVGGDVPDVDALVARTPEAAPGQRHRPAAAAPRPPPSTWTGARWRCATTRAHRRTGSASTTWSSRPARARAGRTCPVSTRQGIHGVQTLDDGERLLESLERDAAPGRRRRRRLHRHRDGRGDVPPRPRGHRARPGRPSRWRPSTRTWAAWCTEAMEGIGHRRAHRGPAATGSRPAPTGG